MKRIGVIVMILVSMVWARDYVKELQAYLTSKSFAIDGIMYSYDFNKNGHIEYNEWVYVSQKSGKKYRLLGTTPSPNNAFGFTQIEVDLQGCKPTGYFSYIGFPQDSDRRFSWIYLQAGEIYKLMGADENHFFKYLSTSTGKSSLSTLTYQLDNQKVFIVYKDFQEFPHIVGAYDTPGYSWAVAVSDWYRAYVADGSGGVVSLDIDSINLYHPQLYARNSAISHALDLLLDSGNSRLYVANGSSVFLLHPNSLDIVKNIALPQAQEIVSLAISTNKKSLYALDGLRQLYVVDVSDPDFPVTITIPGKISAIFVRGNRLYVADSDEGVFIYTLQDPCFPQFMSKIPITGLNSITTSDDGNILYASAYSSTKLYIIDANKKGLIKTVENWHEMCKVVVDYTHHKLYTVNEVSSIDVYDISQQDNPTYIKTIYLPYPAEDLKISSDGRLGFIANGGDGFKIIRLSH